MRRNTILIASLPLANALSLANFQDITSVLIPLTCQLIYDSQIPSCVVADFQDAGCSSECAASLGSVASSVNQACSNVLVNSNTLLGIIKNGGILQALCPKMQKTTTTSPVQQTAPPSAADSVTLPTSSPGVVVGTTSSKSTPTAQPVISTTASHKSVTKSTSSTVETATESTSETTTAAPTSSQSANGSGSDGAATTSTEETSTTSTNKAGQTQKAQTQSDSGGGSPFDISANSGRRLGEGSMLACVVAVWAGIILGR